MKKYTKFYYDTSGFYPFENSSKEKYIYYLSSFLISEYSWLINNNQLDLTEILTEAHEVGFDSTTIGCIIKTKTVYIMDTHEIDEYFYENDLTPLELFEQNLISVALIPLDNFIELMNDWHQLNLQKVPFALLYQDEQDWIACKGFETQEAMEAFIKQHSDEQL